jgi:ADP-dependent NAD(P)H-hydrate dehydratase / NAD(P)H-hydrate epimerase
VLFEPLYTADEMRAAEQGHDVEAMMELAGRGVAERTLATFPEARRFAAVCGKGANGGDGRIALRVLREAGREAEESDDFESTDVIVDAIFGTGFHGEPRPDAAALIERINASGKPVVAVDIPSGVDASTGEVPGAVVEAQLTVTFHGEKLGHFVAPGSFHAGTIERVDIGLEPRETRHSRVTDEILESVPQRGPRDNKYSAGSVLVVGGSPGMSGAVCLTALAAFRADAGYVTVAAPEDVLRVVEVRVLEAVKRPLEDAFGAVERASAVAVGPGLGRGAPEQALVRRFLEEVELPVVVDADALYELRPGNWNASAVLTPHSGELARLLGVESEWVDAHRLAALEQAVERFGCVVVLKGAGTLVGAPGQGVLVAGGFPSLATAGTGDVLTGIVAAFLSKGMEPRLAAAAAVRAHTDAAVAARQKPGLIASDLLDVLPDVLNA